MNGQLTNKVQEHEAFLQEHPNNPEALLELGDLYRELTLNRDAVRCYEWANSQDSTTDSPPALETREIKSRTSHPRVSPAIKSRLSEPEGASTLVCDDCLAVTTSPKFFQREMENLLCPSCHQLRQERSLERGAVFSLLIIVAALAISLLTANQTLWYAFLNLLIFLLLLYPLLTLHEVAHGACASLLGGRVYQMRVGSGKSVFKLMIGKTIVCLHWIPSGGFTRFAFPQSTRLRLRYGITMLAGPLLNLLLFLFVLPEAKAGRFVTGLALTEAFLLSNLFILLGSLLPNKSRHASDLLQITRSFVDPDLELSVGASYALQESRRLLELGRLDEAHHICRSGLERYPDHMPLQIQQGKFLLELDRPHDALVHWESLLETEPQSAEAIAPIHSGIALAYLMSGDSRAYDLARQTFLVAPWLPFTQSTWGEALLAQGECPAAAHHLLEAAQRQSSDRARAVCLANAALGYLCINDRVSAEALIHNAQRLDPKPKAVTTAAQKIFQ